MLVLGYRSYYYDDETGYYYLSSRYYDPKVGRFLNADGILGANGGIAGYNLFAYCNNNPVMGYDPSGRFAIALTTTAVAAVCLSGITVCAVKIADIVSSNLSSTTLFPDMTIDIPDVTIYEPDFYGDTHRDELDITFDDNVEEELPNQGVVSVIPDAPPVDAGKQGKHVPGHNNYNPNKSTWKPGENGVKETQEAWINGESAPGRDGKIRIGRASDGRSIKVHIDGSGKIHGYPIS